ncbi:MAG: 30S ribosomal protein S20 [Dehalococcoidia bacterium]|nr:30S ribosomal protein S20 [Dehalococcoidia bacterium]
MANTAQARKRVRQNIQHAERNKPFRSRAARTLREARAAIAAGSDDAPARVREAQSALDRAARRNIIHPNAAARSKSRLNRALKVAQAA